QRALDDLARRQLRVRDQGTGSREGVRAAGADRDYAVVGLDQLPIARDDEAVLPVRDGEERLEPTEHPIAAPVLRQLHRGTRDVPGIPLELLLELLEQRERIGDRAGEAR